MEYWISSNEALDSTAFWRLRQILTRSLSRPRFTPLMRTMMNGTLIPTPLIWTGCFLVNAPHKIYGCTLDTTLNTTISLISSASGLCQSTNFIQPTTFFGLRQEWKCGICWWSTLAVLHISWRLGPPWRLRTARSLVPAIVLPVC